MISFGFDKFYAVKTHLENVCILVPRASHFTHDLSLPRLVCPKADVSDETFARPVFKLLTLDITLIRETIKTAGIHGVMQRTAFRAVM